MEDLERTFVWHVWHRVTSRESAGEALRSPKKLYPVDPLTWHVVEGWALGVMTGRMIDINYHLITERDGLPPKDFYTRRSPMRSRRCLATWRPSRRRSNGRDQHTTCCSWRSWRGWSCWPEGPRIAAGRATRLFDCGIGVELFRYTEADADVVGPD